MSGNALKIATWNVNSLKVRIPHLVQWLQMDHVDVIALQETKVIDSEFPSDDITNLGYRFVAHGQRTYNGVALLARDPIEHVVFGIPGFPDDQARVIAGTIHGVRVVNVYVPNGQSVDSDKYRYKMRWLEALKSYLQSVLKDYPRVVVLGDFNIAPEDRDVHDPEAWLGQVLVSEPERAHLRAISELGFSDVFRRFPQPDASFSWWDYRQGAFRRNAGLRIDFVLASESMAVDCTACRIVQEPRRWERPSDHTPVIASFNLMPSIQSTKPPKS
jgi:exodeoxyribonuclease-3